MGGGGGRRGARWPGGIAVLRTAEPATARGFGANEPDVAIECELVTPPGFGECAGPCV